jgi:hypothetical protein
MNTCRICVCNPFIINTCKTLDLKSFRMNTYKKQGEGVGYPSSNTATLGWALRVCDTFEIAYIPDSRLTGPVRALEQK